MKELENVILPSYDNTIFIKRFGSSRYGTFGVMLYKDKRVCFTLESVVIDGSKNNGLLPSRYPLSMDWSPRFQCRLPTLKVYGRSGIRVHVGNIVAQTRGCILVGTSMSVSSLQNSRRALRDVINLVKTKNINYLKYV